MREWKNIQWEKTQITNIRKEIGDIIIYPAAIENVIMAYYERLYAHIFDNGRNGSILLKLTKVKYIIWIVMAIK